jgi:hypothetical protein
MIPTFAPRMEGCHPAGALRVEECHPAGAPPKAARVSGSTPPRMPRPYADPYLTGVVLGLVLLAAFVLVGRGLGATGAFASVAASAVNAVSPSAAQGNLFFVERLATGGPWRDWIVVEIAGVFVGGWASAMLARRFRLTIERGASVSVARRLGLAAAGGSLMGVGAVLARGCTSGQALTGGALLSVGSWIFMAGAFAAAYAAAWLMRGAWT